MPLAAQSDWPRPSADRFPARYTVSPEASVFTGTVTFTVSLTDPLTGQLLPRTHWVTTLGVSTSWPAEMSTASRTYWAIAHISGVDELSGWPKVNPPVPVLPPQTCSGIWSPALAAPAMVCSMDWAPLRLPSATSYSPRSPDSTGHGLPTPDPV